nr:hypothetical protein BACY1_03300 [Tenacibaculum mesophilum]
MIFFINCALLFTNAMGYIDLHSKPFDEGTIAKLEIFEDYAEAWIPTFVMKGVESIYIFDFFAGTGYDKNGIKGSPIRLLEKVKKYLGIIFKQKVKIHIYFNEYEPNKKSQPKFDLLKKACNEFIEKNEAIKRACEITFCNEDFEILFPKLKNNISNNPSLVYLDQNGIKFLNTKYVSVLEKMVTTDFLYFSSSSYIKRFGESEEFKQHIDINLNEINNAPYTDIHRVIISELKKTLPVNTNLKLYPYTIKKGKNIYGIIFGAKHPRAVDKFLKIAWNKNEINGEANFDIDNEAKNSQYDIFGNLKMSKIDKFKKNVEEKVLSSEIRNNFELLEYSFDQGHIGKHASDCLKVLKRTKRVSYDSKSPCVTYEKVYKEKTKLEYKVL